MKRYQLLGLVLSAGLVITAPSKAVILYGTDDPSINTTAPDGELAGSGWQYQGVFRRLPRNGDRLELLRYSEPHWWQCW